MAAKSICSICPVVDECGDHAIKAREAFGVWGGMGERERRRIIMGESQDISREQP